MKKIITTAAIYFAIMASTTFVSCNDPKPSDNTEATERSMDQKLDEAGEDWKRERDQFYANVNARIEENEKEIADLKADAKEKKAEARKEYDEAIHDLEVRNDKLRAKLKDGKSETKEGWENFKNEFNHDMDELGQAIGDLFKKNTH